MYSDMSEIPGPDVDVNERAPAQPAPRTMPIEAISSSAWMTATFFFRSRDRRGARRRNR